MAPLISRTEAEPLPLLDTSGSSNIQQDGADRSETEMQKHWDELISKNMDLPDGYLQSSVLIVKWQDNLDQLKVAIEVRDLKALFENTFRYKVEVLELGFERTQLQLIGGITNFAHKYGGDEKLLIVYYAGHGIWHTETQQLELVPTNEDLPPGFTLNKVFWNPVEKHLKEDVDADVLSIMDCCFASNLVRNSFETGRTFEMLSASGVNQVTAEPGERSFTRALINCLEALVRESTGGTFTTRDVLELIQKERPHTPPALWRRLPGGSRHIRLGPQKDTHEAAKGPFDQCQRGFLQLGFLLKEEKLCREQIEELTRHVPKTFNSCGVHVQDIKWIGFRKTGPKSVKDVAEFFIKRRRNADKVPVSAVSRKSPVLSKRKRSDAITPPSDSASEPDGKRQNTGEASSGTVLLD